MNLNHSTTKQTGDQLTAAEWNSLAADVNELGAGGGNTQTVIDASGVISVNSRGNTTISSAKHVNIEPVYDSTGSENGTYGDVQIKPGDDITLESHHRTENKRDEITVKTSNGQSGDSKAPVKLQIIASDMTLSTKGKTEDSNIMNVNVTTGSGKGYLKVRAQAIDLRCEEHGGIAIQPKGQDSQGNENKIKFEHGGGDGLEFGTFNTQKTSIFTDEYRFNKEGVWKMATRTKVASDKAVQGDDTTTYKYVKAEDDFYDNISQDDEQCTTKDIIKTAYAMNGGKDRHTKITNKGAIEIATNATYTYNITSEPDDVSVAVNISTISTKIDTLIQNESIEDGDIFNDGDFETSPTAGTLYTDGNGLYFTFTENAAPDIKIDSGGELKLGGILDFGSTFNFGETDGGIQAIKKFTKKNQGTLKDCDVIQVIGVNNHASNSITMSKVTYVPAENSTPASYTESNITLTPGQTEVLASASLYDIIKLVNYMKANEQGPWEVGL